MQTDPSNDQTFMRRCIALPKRARAADETPVGALVVWDGAVVAEAGEATCAHRDPGAHAEILAIRAACRKRSSTDLSDCTLYTTVEPCVFCSYLIRKTAIARVVYGIPADQIGGATSRYAILTDSSLSGWAPPPVVVAGVLAEECAAIRRT